MLPKLLHNTEISQPRSRLDTGYSVSRDRSINTTQHTRYMSYDKEPTEIGRLKKVKEFLCGDED